MSNPQFCVVGDSELSARLEAAGWRVLSFGNDVDVATVLISASAAAPISDMRWIIVGEQDSVALLASAVTSHTTPLVVTSRSDVAAPARCVPASVSSQELAARMGAAPSQAVTSSSDTPPTASPPVVEPISLKNNPTLGAAPWQKELDQEINYTGSAHVLGMCAAKGGAGKTTTTLWLAEALSAAGDRVAVVDADVAKPNLASVLGIYDTHLTNKGLTALLNVPRIHGELLASACLKVPGLGVLLPGASSPMSTTPAKAITTLRETLRVLRAKFQWVLIDLPVATVHESLLTEFALLPEVCDQLIVITNPSHPTLESTQRFLREASRPVPEGGVGLDLSRCVGLLTRSGEAENISYDNVRDWLPELSFAGAFPFQSGVVDAVNAKRWHAPASLKEPIARFCADALARSPSDSAPQKEKQPAHAREVKKRKKKKRRKR